MVNEMITKVYLKSQSKKSIDYPDCYPILSFYHIVVRNDNIGKNEASYLLKQISRIEFRP